MTAKQVLQISISFIYGYEHKATPGKGIKKEKLSGECNKNIRQTR
jgi:hypothetical protein